MSTHEYYSTIFTTIYDQPESISDFSNGVHYSIMRAVEWLDVERNSLSAPEIHDFAILWDRDHDVRIINVIEKLYLTGLLSPIQFIGEHKGVLTIILASKYEYNADDVGNYKKQVSEIVSSLDFDSWICSFGTFDRSGADHQCLFNELLSVSHKNTFYFLKSIDLQWKLGTYTPCKKISNL